VKRQHPAAVSLGKHSEAHLARLSADGGGTPPLRGNRVNRRRWKSFTIGRSRNSPQVAERDHPGSFDRESCPVIHTADCALTRKRRYDISAPAGALRGADPVAELSPAMAAVPRSPADGTDASACLCASFSPAGCSTASKFRTGPAEDVASRRACRHERCRPGCRRTHMRSFDSAAMSWIFRI
jgi:hypothetical protein